MWAHSVNHGLTTAKCILSVLFCPVQTSMNSLMNTIEIFRYSFPYDINGLRDDALMPRQGFLICNSVESACVQHLDQLSADMCSHEQLVRLMQRDSASYGSSVQQVFPYVPKKNPVLTKVMIHHLFKLHHRQSLHCNASLWREPLPFLFWRPPDTLLLMLKTQPSLLHFSSWMRSCILSSCTSQAHTCPTATCLGGGGVWSPPLSYFAMSSLDFETLWLPVSAKLISIMTEDPKPFEPCSVKSKEDNVSVDMTMTFQTVGGSSGTTLGHTVFPGMLTATQSDDRRPDEQQFCAVVCLNKSDRWGFIFRWKSPLLYGQYFVYTPNKACTQLVAVNVRLTLTCVPATNLWTCRGVCGSGSRNMRSNLHNIFQMSRVTPFTVSVVAQAKSHKGEICFVFYYKVGKCAVQES